MHISNTFKIYTSFIFLGLSLFFWGSNLEARSSSVYFVQLEDSTINPVTAEYITKGIAQAEEADAQALVIKMDTPGGLLSSTRLIVKNMLKAEIPLVVHVAPGGSRAGSAGVFITYASHIAAMAPSTNIGAAHPVTMGPGNSTPKSEEWQDLRKLVEDLKAAQEKSSDTAKEGEIVPEAKEVSDEGVDEVVPDKDPMGSKILQDTVAFIKSIAKERNRNIEWAIESVAKSASITDQEAFNKGVVEIIAETDQELLMQLHGRVVNLHGKEVSLETQNASIQYLEMTPAQKFFNILADPNIAYFLMILGFYGLMFEITHPGFGIPGILGAIFLILAFYSMQTLPTNYAGVALVGFGLILLIAEVYTPTFGLMSIGGLVCLVLGSLLLFDSVDPIMRVSKVMIFTATGTIGAVTFFLLGAMVKNQRKHVHGGAEGLVGATGQVQRSISKGDQGKVFVQGEIWSAICDEPVEPGDKIIVEGVEGMVLTVSKKIDI